MLGLLPLVNFSAWMKIFAAVPLSFTSWTLILGFLVFWNLWYLFETGFLKGTIGRNAYGPDPLD